LTHTWYPEKHNEAKETKEEADTLIICLGYALAGANNTGWFARIGKRTWFKLLMEAEGDVIETLSVHAL